MGGAKATLDFHLFDGGEPEYEIMLDADIVSYDPTLPLLESPRKVVKCKSSTALGGSHRYLTTATYCCGYFKCIKNAA